MGKGQLTNLQEHGEQRHQETKDTQVGEGNINPFYVIFTARVYIHKGINSLNTLNTPVKRLLTNLQSVKMKIISVIVKIFLEIVSVSF